MIKIKRLVVVKFLVTTSLFNEINDYVKPVLLNEEVFSAISYINNYFGVI